MKKSMTLLLAVLLALLCACGKGGEAAWQEQYDLGVQYLSEGNHEEAILALNAAIDSDPTRADAYAQLAEVYLAVGDPARAVEALERGFVFTGDESLRTRAEELSAPPSIEGVWVCEGRDMRVTLTLDADGHGTWESTYQIGDISGSGTVEVDLRQYSDLAELGDKLFSADRDWAILDTTGNYLLARWPFVREGGASRGVEPDPKLTGSWETQTNNGMGTYAFGADGVVIGTLGDRIIQAPYVVFPAGDGNRNMMLTIAENDYMGDNDAIFYEVVEIDGVEHLYMAGFNQNFTQPDMDMTRVGQGSGTTPPVSSAAPSQGPAPGLAGPRTERVDAADGSYKLHYYDAAGNRVRSESYSASGMLSQVDYFDEAGNWIQVDDYNPDGSMLYYIFMHYDEAGNRTWDEVYHPNGALYQVSYYNGTGYKEQTEVYYQDGTLNQIIYFDGAGNRVRVDAYNPDRTLLFTTYYNAAGNRERQEWYDTGSYTLYYYDAAGNLTREEHYDADGVLQGVEGPEAEPMPEPTGSRVEREDSSDGSYALRYFNEEGRLTQVESYDPDGILKEYSLGYYNENGRRIRLEYYSPNGMMKYYKLYYYDNAGNMIREERYGETIEINYYSEDGFITRYEWYDIDGTLLDAYEYDEDG